MVPRGPLLKSLVVALVALLLVPIGSASQHDEGDDADQPGRSDDRRQDDRDRDDDQTTDDDETTDDDNETSEDRSGNRGRGEERSQGRGGDDDEDDDEDDDDDERGRGRGRGATVREQVGRFQTTEAHVDGRFVSFGWSETGITDYTYANTSVFTLITFDPSFGALEVERKGAQVELEGDDAAFKAFDTPSGHFKAETDDGTLRLTLAPGWNATFVADADGEDTGKIRLQTSGLTAFVTGDREGLVIENGTIVADDEVRFIVHAPGLRGHLSPHIDDAVEDGQIVAEVLVGADAEDTVAIENGPVNLTTERSAGNVTVTIEGHGAGRTLLFDVDRDALGRVEDLRILFDGREIRMADDIADVLNTSADEDAEYILLVGHNKTQVLVGIPHFSTHTVTLQSVGVVDVITPILGSPAAFAVAAIVAGLFVAATWSIRNRQR